jgi:hypothetical protein
MAKESILKKIAAIPESKIPEEGRPNGIDITEDEFKRGLQELADKYKDRKPANPMTPEEIRERGQAILDAMNKANSKP